MKLSTSRTISTQNGDHSLSVRINSAVDVIRCHCELNVGIGKITLIISTLALWKLDYDYDKMVPVYGFGATTNFPSLKSSSVLHCFPLTGNSKNTEVHGLDGIMDVYSTALTKLNFSGPTLFVPLLKEMEKVAKKHKAENTGVYTILLIMTDGEIVDMEESIEVIHKLANLPISIIIVGVGYASFSKMETLDGDDGLYNKKGQKCPRDLVQFVPFRKFKDNKTQLAREVLAEIPEQLTHYMFSTGIMPAKPQAVDISQLVSKFDSLQQK